jgi:L-fuconolactonase
MIDHNVSPSRRAFLAAAATATVAAAQSEPIPIIDTHFHIYDATRPQGAPFPKTPNPPPFLPKHFRETAIPLGISGGIEVEASPWLEDNLWVLMTIESEPMITGTIGNLNPNKPDFGEYLERFHRNKLFLGIRYGNVWEGQDLAKEYDRPQVISNLKLFAQTGLTLEIANPRVDLTEATLRVLDKVPDLRIVMGHQQAMGIPADPAVRRSYESTLRELRQRNAYVKISGLYRGRADAALDPAVYKPVMDFLWDIFGEDRVVYAGRNKQALEILQAYCLAKGRAAAEKYFWKNSVGAFRWVRRDPKQPQLA